MAIEINLPKVDVGHNEMTATRAHFSQSVLSGLNGMVVPADHQNQLFDNLMGFKPHAFAPTDIAHNPVNSH